MGGQRQAGVEEETEASTHPRFSIDEGDGESCNARFIVGGSREETSAAIREEGGGEGSAREGNGEHKDRRQAAGVEDHSGRDRRHH